MTNDTLQFYLKMKDLMSGGLVKMGQTAQKTFNKVQGHVDKVTQKNKILGSSYDALKRKISAVESTISRSNSVSQIRAARRELSLLQRQANSHVGNTSRRGGLMSSLGGSFPALGFAGALALGGSAFNNSLAKDSRFNAINFGTGGNGTQAIESVRGINDKYGVSNRAGLEGFQKLSGSIKAPLGQQLEIYESITAASRAMGLSADQSNGAILALSQMASKGTVQAEELRGQLGERIPGAFRLAAESMGVTEKALNKMLQAGDVASDVFLPKFAAHLQKTFGPSAMKAAEGPAATFERFKNVLYDISVMLGEVLLPPLIGAMKLFIEYKEIIGIVAAGILGFALATKIAAFSWAGLNLAFLASPIGWVVGGLAALVVGIAIAYNKFEGFRKVVHGLWSAFKQVFSNIAGLFKATFSPMMEAITAFQEGRYTDAAKAVALLPAAATIGAAKYIASGGLSKGVVDAYKTGAQEGVRSKISTTAIANSSSSSGALGGASASGGGATSEAVRGVVRGGPRVVNINGVKLIETLNMSVSNLDEGIDEMEDKLKTLLLRLLNSGAAVQ